MFDRFSRSWQLVKASADVLRQDKELLVFPLVSSIAMLVVMASFVGPILAAGWVDQIKDSHAPTPWMWLWMFAFYMAQYTVIFFFNSALIGAATIRLRGGDPTVGDGFRIALAKIGPILGYAAIAATVGMILRMIEERAGFIGRIVAGLLGVGWTVATFLAVPILVNEDLGAIDAVKKSASLLKKTWGENLIGNVGIGLVMGLIIAAVVFVGVALGVFAIGTRSAPFAITVFVLMILAVMILALIQAALQGVYAAAVYRYAEEGRAGASFDDALLGSAFRIKGR